MPYRRLPNTDLSRIAALQAAIKMEGHKENGELVLSYQTIRDAQQILTKFRNLQRAYQQYYDQFIQMSKTFREEQHMAHMYISHFIQVLNMTIQRGELRKDIKEGYGLDPESTKMPTLKSDHDVAEWGEKIIRGEEQRIAHGGVPIYNPNIAKVKVHFSIFADHYYNMNTLRQNIAKYLQELTDMRPLVDDLLQDMWNQVENSYTDLPLSARLDKCQQYGIVYFLRTSEKKLIEAEKMQSRLEFI